MTTIIDDLESYLPANCPNPYYDTWDRHNSIAFSKTKGLRNAPGENNCFLNSAVQVFWHLDVFRRSYRCLTGHVCMGNSCIFCALKVIFTQLQYSDQTSLHPDALRKALAETFANQQRFQLGHMDDAAECFENILRRIHLHIANDHSEDDCTAPHCLPHQKFAMSVCDQIVCPCGASSKPHNFQEMVHYVTANNLVSQARVMQKSGDILHPDRFGLLLRSAVAMGDIRACPGNCGKSVQIRRTLKSCPDVVSVGLVWDSDHPSIEMTTEVARNIGTTIMLQDVFHSVLLDMTSLPKLHLVGVVCYYGKHYSTFVFHSKLKVWIYFDDATVKEIGPNWSHVVDKCMRGRYQPLLLLYANPAATPVPVETAMKKRTMAEGYSFPASAYDDSDSGLDRTHESIKSMPARRSRTPNPDQHANTDTGRRAVTPGPENWQNDASRPSGKQIQAEHKRQPSFLYAMSGKPTTNNAQPMVNGSYHPERDILYGGQSSGNLQTLEEDGDGNYTLSTKDPFRRPSLNFDPTNLPVTQAMARGNEALRKDSFKKGKERVRSDVVRYQVSPTSQPTSLEYPRAHPNTISSGEDSVSINSDIVSPNQHRVVRPKPSSHTYENIENMSHSPVQSGLATLPRKKKLVTAEQYRSESEINVLNRQNSMGNIHIKDQVNKPLNKKAVPIPVSMPVIPNSANMRQEGQQGDCVDGGPPCRRAAPPPPGQPQRPVPPVPNHDKQGSSSKTTDGKKSKVKKSAKNGEKRKNKKNKDGDFVDDPIMYIERSMVENILKHQGVQRQGSSVSNASYTSGSSIESDSMIGRLLAGRNGEGKKALSVEIPYDNVSIGSYKDSGYGSSDRNSSSSTGSETVNPYSVYFLSRGMIVPNSINNHHPAYDRSHSLKSSPSPDSHHDNPMSEVSKQGPPTMNGQMGSDQHHQKHHDQLHGRQVLHPIKERSFEDTLRSSPAPFQEATKTVVEVRRPGQPASSSPSPAPSPPEPLPTTMQREAAVCSDHFLMLCHKSDDLMDQCILSETDGKLEEAQRFCDSASGCLREAMNQKNITHQSLVYAQRKHNACLLKARSLALRINSRAMQDRSGDSQCNSRVAMNSSDSDTSSQDGSSVRSSSSRDRLQKCAPGSLNPSSSSQSHPNKAHLRTDSGLSHHDRQGSSSSQHHRQSSSTHVDVPQKELREDVYSHHPVTRSNSDQFTHNHTMVHSHTDSNLSAKSASSHASSQFSGSQENIDIYATLPRRKNKKPVDPKPKDADVYQSYLNKQKSLNSNISVDHMRTSSGSSTPNSMDGRESDSGSSTGRSSKLSQSEIRDLLERKYMRRQQEQINQRFSNSHRESSSSQPVNGTPSYPHQQQLHQQQQQQQPASHQQLLILPRKYTVLRQSGPGSQQAGNKPTVPQKNVSMSTSRGPSNGLPPKPTSSYGSQYLNVPQHQGRPLERSASQPDCQKLVDSSLASNPGGRGPSNSRRGRGDLHPPSSWPGQLSTMRQNSASQPDLRSNQLLINDTSYCGSDNSSELDDVKPNVSVRALASRFETVTVEPQTRRHPVRKQNSDAGYIAQRQRSKSESNSSVKKPKSVLKNKKAKNNWPRKSVTFCEDIARVANIENSNLGYESAAETSSPRLRVDDRAYYSDDEDRYSHKPGYADSEVEDMDSSNSDESPPAGVPGDQLCHLCSKRCVVVGSQFCVNCQFYMSRMMPNSQ
ncbi:uncharacterized protein LOC124275061 [Haliotis rubra]|uniref:uncharacterized protein LOC124275061 n=1 Tax=Haliotis rubra TaxID=36100 RepID=UPI001EE593D2|nr:uncharacterized protein LOC124275061 [Haliotis rubra]